MRIKEIVEKLVKKYKTTDLYELADYLNIIIIEHELDPSIKGFYHYFQRNKIIHINKNLNINKKITLAHEIGHAVLHTKLNVVFMEYNTYFVADKYEFEANKFAAEILVPDNLLDTYSDYTLQQISCLTGIPEFLIELKFSDLSIC